MKATILKTLKQIELDYDVKVLYACESGSRAWGFPSKDSDYDVRFIYVHKPEYYLSIDPVGIGKKKDVIELPINDLLDVTGWELTKALKLFRKSNPPLLEWMNSGIVYYRAFTTIERMKQLSQSLFTPNSCLYHYLNMANNNFREYLKSDTVRIKKYFYVLRPVLAARWIEAYNEFPPMVFQTLVEKLIPDGELKTEINILLERKIRGDELDMELRIDVIHSFIETELPRLAEYAKTVTKDREDPTPQLDQLFRSTLKEVWK
ncbi:nucleotidyltransferase domain-containing protein [Bacillus sp. AGMB 02131]|uniref:Nucleotidyltransferase domain-containing protein n=1 Tax=Peribacillus faecalis TaxID=2772559 RepID=A0A927CTB9_9BACI|nr:nucleotidyltransferase domain-containing protein [Peribacillus faecalis]MBD3107493.1 nucleotidyltransferase domain-containing protein [Peribacillus faecalis]